MEIHATQPKKDNGELSNMENVETVILQFFKKFTDSVSTDLQFVIDDISDEDTAVVGVTWHLEWKGKNFPFSKGCSFYRLEVVKGQRQIM
ncbi:unnamed protein product [Ilex paraguariensis]|uniref:SnoaL-like domain-containing protein n=1 Tax=Ilex paraguariensis TaxID=185542 RepID=A0ABC8S3W3_9AQUA